MSSTTAWLIHTDHLFKIVIYRWQLHLSVAMCHLLEQVAVSDQQDKQVSHEKQPQQSKKNSFSFSATPTSTTLSPFLAKERSPSERVSTPWHFFWWGGRCCFLNWLLFLMFRLPIKGGGKRGRLFSCENLHPELIVFPSFLNLPSKVINSTDYHDNSAFKCLRLRGDKVTKCWNLPAPVWLTEFLTCFNWYNW